MPDQSSMLDTVEEAIESIGRGEIVVVVDDESSDGTADTARGAARALGRE